MLLPDGNFVSILSAGFYWELQGTCEAPPLWVQKFVGFFCERCCPIPCFPEFSNVLSTKLMFIWLSLSYVFILLKDVKFSKPWLFCLRMCTTNVHLTISWVRNGSWRKFYNILRIGFVIVPSSALFNFWALVVLIILRDYSAQGLALSVGHNLPTSNSYIIQNYSRIWCRLGYRWCALPDDLWCFY